MGRIFSPWLGLSVVPTSCPNDAACVVLPEATDDLARSPNCESGDLPVRGGTRTAMTWSTPSSSSAARSRAWVDKSRLPRCDSSLDGWFDG